MNFYLWRKVEFLKKDVTGKKGNSLVVTQSRSLGSSWNQVKEMRLRELTGLILPVRAQIENTVESETFPSSPPLPPHPFPSLLFFSFPFLFSSSSFIFKKKHFNYRNFLTNTKEERIIWWTSMCSSLSSSSYKHMVILISSIPLHSSPSPLSPAGLF